MEAIISIVQDKINEMYGKSFYFRHEDKLVRVSDHLPSIWNLDNYNENTNAFLFIFVGNESNGVSEGDIENFIWNEMKNQEVDTYIVSECDCEENFRYLSSKIGKFLA